MGSAEVHVLHWPEAITAQSFAAMSLPATLWPVCIPMSSKPHRRVLESMQKNLMRHGVLLERLRERQDLETHVRAQRRDTPVRVEEIVDPR